ncbi:MAG: NUDIX pyrophosphatase [Ignavibacteriae bacterium]|nr:NUDIX pyrophosphatase [Ignavibacteriota bacterium]
MARQPINVLVFPFRKNSEGEYEFAVFKRADNPFWQAISGGVEDDEELHLAASRECYEEAGIPKNRKLYKLSSHNSIPAYIFYEHAKWGDAVYLVDEHSFAIEAHDHEIILSHEHTEYKWLSFEKATEILRFDSNKTALYELHSRLKNDNLR